MAPSGDQCEIYIHSAAAVQRAHTRGGFITGGGGGGGGAGGGRGGGWREGGGGRGAHALTWRRVMQVVSTSMIAAVRTFAQPQGQAATLCYP